MVAQHNGAFKDTSTTTREAVRWGGRYSLNSVATRRVWRKRPHHETRWFRGNSLYGVFPGVVDRVRVPKGNRSYTEPKIATLTAYGLTEGVD